MVTDNIFTPTEIKYINNKKSVSSPGALKKRIVDKLMSLKDKEVLYAMGRFIEEPDQLEIIKNLLNSLKMDSIEKKLIYDYMQFQKEFEQCFKEEIKKDKNQGRTYFNYAYYVYPLWQAKGLMKAIKKIGLDKKMAKDFLKDPKIILSLKISYDISSILKIQKRKEIMLSLIKHKNPIKINKLIKDKKSEIIIKEFYELGVILLKGVKKEDFLERCEKEFIKMKGKLGIKKGSLKFLLYLYKWNKKNKKLYVRLNPLYKKSYKHLLEEKKSLQRESTDNLYKITLKIKKTY